LKKLIKEQVIAGISESGISGSENTQQNLQQLNLLDKMNKQMTAMNQAMANFQNIQTVQQNVTALDVEHRYEHPDGTIREIPEDFDLDNTTIVDAWRFESWEIESW